MADDRIRFAVITNFDTDYEVGFQCVPELQHAGKVGNCHVSGQQDPECHCGCGAKLKFCMQQMQLRRGRLLCPCSISTYLSGSCKRSILQTMGTQILALRAVTRRDADGVRGTSLRVGEDSSPTAKAVQNPSTCFINTSTFQNIVVEKPVGRPLSIRWFSYGPIPPHSRKMFSGGSQNLSAGFLFCLLSCKAAAPQGSAACCFLWRINTGPWTYYCGTLPFLLWRRKRGGGPETGARMNRFPRIISDSSFEPRPFLWTLWWKS